MVCLLAALLSSPVLLAQTQKKDAKSGAPAAASAQEAATPAAAEAGYVIGAEDTLNVNVWKEPDMSGTVPVRPDGKISLPLVGDVQATGLTPMELTAQLTTLLKKYVTDPRVTVTVTNVNSRRVYILGQVGRPGAYPLAPEMTVLQALSTAGGLNQFAAADKIYVLRNDSSGQVKLAFQYKQVIKGRKPEQNVVLKPGDTIVIP
jgi:polysaccharide export outer membrane protein